MKGILSKTFVFALCTVLLISLNSCEDKGAETDLSYRIVVEDHSTSYSFPTGVYYSYVFPQPYSYEFDVDAVLKRAVKAGMKLRDAWYKGYNTNCVPPGSNIAMPAIVEPSLLIRLDSPASTLEQSSFVQTQNPNTGFCNYRVNRYIFLN